MQIAVLCAGKGSRLGKLTVNKPKCLLKFRNVDLLQYKTKIFKNFFFSQKYIVTGYKSKNIKTAYYKKIHNKSYASTNMVFSLNKIKKYLKYNSDLIVCYGDIIFDKKLFQKIYDSKNKSDIDLISDINYKKLWNIRSNNIFDDIETFKVNKGYVTNLGEKITDNSYPEGQFIGLIKIKHTKLNSFFKIYENLVNINKKNMNMYMTDYLNYLIKKNWKIKEIKVKNGWLEFDTAVDVKKYNYLYEKNKLNKIINIKKILNQNE